MAHCGIFRSQNGYTPKQLHLLGKCTVFGITVLRLIQLLCHCSTSLLAATAQTFRILGFPQLAYLNSPRTASGTLPTFAARPFSVYQPRLSLQGHAEQQAVLMPCLISERIRTKQCMNTLGQKLDQKPSRARTTQSLSRRQNQRLRDLSLATMG